MGKTAFRIGDVVRYYPEDRHCREGMAIVGERSDGRVILVDTFWGSMNDSHVLTDAEEATAELLFNKADYDEVPRHMAYCWKDYAPADRRAITSQHGLQRRLFIRKGATEDHATKVENAREKLAEAERDLESAKSAVQWAIDDLARVQAEQWAAQS